MSGLLCQHCGSPLPQEARFCPTCGERVGGEATAEERRVVTVLFADLAGSSELAGSLDPERFREVQSAFYRAASEEVEALRGRTEKFVGDAIMAVFGLPIAHDDDALRGVRAGLQVRDRVARVGERLGLPAPLEVRVGVNTGPVVATTAPAGELLVSGAPVNAAGRLQEAADPGEVLAGSTTWELTRHAASFGEARTVDAKGFRDGLVARPVTGLFPRSTRRTIPLVGRRRDLEFVRGAFERAVETGRPHVVTIVGEPGIGKTRLVEELKAGVPERTEVLVGRASEFGEDVTFAPLAEMIRRRLGVEGDTDPDAVRARLEDVVAGCCEPSDVDQVAARLGLLLDIGEESDKTTRYRAAEIRAGLGAFLAGLARRGPVLLVIDDLHLARPPLLEVLEQVVRDARRVPLTLVAVGREDLLTRPGWGGGSVPDSLVLRIEPLGFGEAVDLARAAGEQVDDETAERIARQAGGNPFFIIETTGMMLHERSHGRRPAVVLPPTVQAVVASRIDHLPERARDLVRKASVFPGGAFHESKLALVATVDPSILRTLEEEELVLPDPERPGRWRFRHDLLREVAYESLAKRERRRLHEALAGGIEGMGEAERHAQQIAYHLEEAARAARDLDPNDAEPPARAETALQRAGDLCRRRMESRASVDLYERALSQASAPERWGPQEAQILAGIGEAKYWLGEYEEAERNLTRALDVAPDDLWARALAGRFLADIALNIHGDPERAEVLFAGALDAARESENDWAMARTMLMAGWVPYWRDDLRAARRIFEEALAIARANPGGDRWAEARALNSLVSVVSPIDDARDALSLAEEALTIGREIGDPFTIAGAQENVGTSLRRMWRLDEALAASNEAVQIYGDLGAAWEVASATGERGTIHRLAGRLDEAEADLREALRLCLGLGERALVIGTASELSYVLYLRGDLEAARQALEEVASAGERAERLSWTNYLLQRALLALAAGEEEEARRLAVEGIDLERLPEAPNWVAANVWWVGRVFGPDLVGGESALEDARARLESMHWLQALREPELVKLPAR